MYNKRDELASRLEGCDYDIVAITEWLPKNRTLWTSTEIDWKLEGYTIISNGFNHTGRGIILYVKSDISFSEVTVPEFQEIEQVSVLIHTEKRESVLVQCIYRSPNSSDDALQELDLLFKTNRVNDTTPTYRVILGDFNFREIDWKQETTSASENHISTKFLEICRDNFLLQQVDRHTRYRDNSNPSMIDLIFTNMDSLVSDISYLPPLGNSDHVVLTFDVNVNSAVNNVCRQKPLFFKADYVKLKTHIQELDWKLELEKKSMEDAWSTFMDKISNIIKKDIPVRKSGSRYYRTPWMNETACKAIKAKRKAWRNYIYNTNIYTSHIYKEKRKEASKCVKEAKVEYERSLAKNIKSDSKAFWRYVKSKTKVKESIPGLRDDSGNEYSDNINKALILNEYFASVFTQEDKENLPMFEERNFNNTLETIIIQKEKIQKHLEKLNTSKSMGIDGLHPKFLKETAEEISEPIFTLCKISLEQSKIPEIWKHANVTAIFKKGQKDLPSNYRPICLTSIVCKIMETFIRDSIVQHMDSNSLFTKHQYGFRKGSSCVTQLIDVIDNWTKSLDDRKDIDVIYFDFRKAFDTVPHERLLKKLYAYGIRGNVLSWIRDFLKERKQRVVLNGEESNWLDVTSGIPQGSVLGPILFLVYINDLPEVVHNAVKLFADDTKLYGNSCTDEDQHLLQDDINSLIQWSDSWLLKFNISKCKHMHLGNRNTPTT